MRGTASPINGFCATSARQFALSWVFPQAVRFRCAEDGAPYAAPRLKPRPVHRFAWTAFTGGTAPSPQRQKADKPKPKLTRKKKAKISAGRTYELLRNSPARPAGLTDDKQREKCKCRAIISPLSQSRKDHKKHAENFNESLCFAGCPEGCNPNGERSGMQYPLVSEGVFSYPAFSVKK